MAKRYGNEIRAKAEAMFHTGESLSVVATALNINKSTCSRWKAAMPATALQQIATRKEIDFEQKLSDYLKELIDAAMTMAKTVNDSDYIRQQPAGGMATLIAVTSDRIFRLMEARQKAESITIRKDTGDGKGRREEEPELNYDEFAKEFNKLFTQNRIHQENEDVEYQ